jgi:hypothetical protein
VIPSPFYAAIKGRALTALAANRGGPISRNRVWFAVFQARDDVAVSLTAGSTFRYQVVRKAMKFSKSDFKRAEAEIMETLLNGDSATNLSTVIFRNAP